VHDDLSRQLRIERGSLDVHPGNDYADVPL
jgi:hypothetical protein